MLSRSSKRFRLPSFMVLAWLALGLASACSKKEKEPRAAEDQPPAKSAVAAVAARPAPALASAKCDPESDGKCKPSPTCSPDCKPIATPDCVKCEAGGDCAPFANNCESPLLSADDKKICYEIQTCVETSRCFEGAKTTLGSCYCGNLDLKSCLAAPMSGPGAPAGACHDVILKGMPNAKNQSHVLGNLTTRDRAAGLALSRLNCQKVGYKQTCARVCGWLPG